MASGIAALHFSQFAWLPQIAARGQVSHLPASATPPARTITEDERVAHIRETYRQEGIDLDHLPSAPLPEGVQSIVEDRLHRVIAQAVTERFGV